MFKILIHETITLILGFILMLISINIKFTELLVNKSGFISFLPAIFFIIGAVIFIYGGLGRAKYLKKQVSKLKRKKGEEGENSVHHYLKSLNNNKFISLHSLVLFDPKNPRYNQEFDSLVIGKNAIFNIETKAYGGHIKIASTGNWTREKGNKVERIDSPAIQAKRHRSLLENIVGTSKDLVDLIIIANDKTTISGIENSPVKILKVEALTNFIENFKGKDSNDINKIKNHILKYKTQRDTSKYDRTKENPLFYIYMIIKILFVIVILISFINPSLIKIF
ncbi:MAG: nuclease-related domain-containing protein [Clostridiaceae bacterium]